MSSAPSVVYWAGTTSGSFLSGLIWDKEVRAESWPFGDLFSRFVGRSARSGGMRLHDREQRWTEGNCLPRKSPLWTMEAYLIRLFIAILFSQLHFTSLQKTCTLYT